MKAAKYFLMSAVMLVGAGTAAGATLSVPTDYSTIQDAINAAVSGVDEIAVNPGTYPEAIDFGGKAIRLYSTGGAAVTTIDGTGNYHVVKCVSGEGSDTILEGFTITNGNTAGITGTFPDTSGAGMYNDNSSPTVKDCIFTNNRAWDHGGGMLNNNNSSPTVTGCKFISNASNGTGGGMDNFGSGNNPTVTNCVFQDNLAVHLGGAMNNGAANPEVTGCTFTGNSADLGGAMFNAGSSLTVRNCTFSKNSCSLGDGGALYNDSGGPTVVNCIFTGNSAAGTGGAIDNEDAHPTVVNCLFTANSAGTSGGAVNNKGSSGGSNPSLINCTFSGNSSGALSTDTGSSTTVVNCILWDDNGPEIQGLGTTTVSYSDVDGPPFSGSTHNTNADPLFDSDYHLQAGSPCINAGNNSAIPSGITTDLAGNPRIQNGTVDMGAYESPDHAPEILSITAPVDPVPVHTAVAVSATFTDPDAGDTHKATWDWGDTTSSAGTVVSEPSGSTAGSISDGHTYTAAGVYTLTLTVTDQDNNSDTKTYQYVVVYDPSAGFVTGGGWIDSAAHAYKEDPSLTGKATFGFVSKYKKGATVPDGTTEFQFRAGDLSFQSSSYEWLVITGSNFAKFKGTGTINGAGTYKFQVWAGDGPDTFRIRIWTENAGTETDVYDNGFNQLIGEGSTVIHTK